MENEIIQQFVLRRSLADIGHNKHHGPLNGQLMSILTNLLDSAWCDQFSTSQNVGWRENFNIYSILTFIYTEIKRNENVEL